MPEGISCYLLLRAAVLDGVQCRAKVFAPIAGVLSRVFSGVFFGVSFRVSVPVFLPVACGVKLGGKKRQECLKQRGKKCDP